MATKLKSYEANSKERAPVPAKPTPSGVACPHAMRKEKCKGQMMLREPREPNPELDGLDRADCSQKKKCGYMGWV